MKYIIYLYPMLVDLREDEKLSKVKRILEIVSQQGITVYKIAKNTNLNQSGLNRWINDRNEITGVLPNIRTINIVLQYLESEVHGDDSETTISTIPSSIKEISALIPPKFKRSDWVLENLRTLIENIDECTPEELTAIHNGVIDIINQRNELIERLSKISQVTNDLRN